MRKFLLILLALVVLSGVAFAAGKPTIVMVVKLEGVAWFDNMRLGIQAFAKDYPDVDAYQTGADTADPAAQAKIIEDLIAKGVNAILAVPNDPSSLVPAFKRANAAGIFTLTHEASVQQQVSYDIEAFDNLAYGKHMMDVMAKWMGDKGMWQPFVGHLTSTTHNQWVDGEIAEAKAKYPGLKMATDRVEEQENQQIAHDKALELLKTYPGIKTFMGSAMSTVPGAAQAITEKGLIGKVAAFGTCLPSVAGDYIQSGAVNLHSLLGPRGRRLRDRSRGLRAPEGQQGHRRHGPRKARLQQDHHQEEQVGRARHLRRGVGGRQQGQPQATG